MSAQDEVMFFITGIAYTYGYGERDEEPFYHPVIAVNEGQAINKVKEYYESNSKEVKGIKSFKTIK